MVWLKPLRAMRATIQLQYGEKVMQHKCTVHVKRYYRFGSGMKQCQGNHTRSDATDNADNLLDRLPQQHSYCSALVLKESAQMLHMVHVPEAIYIDQRSFTSAVHMCCTNDYIPGTIPVQLYQRQTWYYTYTYTHTSTMVV